MVIDDPMDTEVPVEEEKKNYWLIIIGIIVVVAIIGILVKTMGGKSKSDETKTKY